MDFLLGFASILPMALFNKSIIKLVPKINPALTLGIAMIMLFGTAAITIFWAVALQVEVDNSNSFLLGLSAALFMNMGGKILHLLQNPIED